ncbi:phage antirepressor N-terminal domain-containing protein [Bacillus thuringiensis]
MSIYVSSFVTRQSCSLFFLKFLPAVPATLTGEKLREYKQTTNFVGSKKYIGKQKNNTLGGFIMTKQTIVDVAEQKVVAVEQQLVNFNGAEIMAVKANDEKIHIGVKWVCKGIGLSDDQMRNERKKIQSDLVLNRGGSNLTLPTNSGIQEVLCIELNYLPLWLAKISITPNMRSNQPELTQNLITYQLKAKDVLADAFLKKDAKPKQPKPHKKPVNLIFRQEMDMAKILASVAGVKEGIAYAVAIERAEQKTGENFSSYKKLLPAATYETGFLNPTSIGERIGKKARGVVNQLRLEQGLQVKEDKEWRLTDEGKKHAEEMPYTRNGHSGYQIQWNESVVERLQV